MAEGIVQLPQDGTGKKLRTQEVTIGGQLVEQEVVTLALSDGTLVPGTFGRLAVTDLDPELGVASALTSLRDRMVAQRYTVLADSVADGLASFWTQATASGGSITVGGGEGVFHVSGGNGSQAQMSSIIVRYFPGQSTWFNSAFRFGDTGLANNVRRLGVFTLSGTTPQDGHYFELNGTTFNAVVVKNGVVQSSTASAGWSRASVAPFTLDVNYHSFEIRYTANRVDFYIDNVLRHTYAGTTSAITNTLDFPISVQNFNTAGTAGTADLALRNCGVGRFGNPPTEYTSGQVLADQAGAGGVLTFTFATPVDFVWVTDVGSTTTNVSRADPYGGTPSATTGVPVFNATPTPLAVAPPSATVKVWAPAGSTISVHGQRYI